MTDNESRILNLKAIVRQLLVDNNTMALTAQIPNTLAGLQRMMRALENTRPALPASDSFIQAEAEELQLQLGEKGVVTLDDIPGGKIRLWQGDITRLQVGAIVNAANSGMTGCWAPLHACIDNAIHSAAGVRLRIACDQLRQTQGHPEPTGQAKITPAYNLPCQYVLHTVGPIIEGDSPTPHQHQQLADCYTHCLELAAQHGLESVAFCCISTGVFRFPKAKAAEIAVRTVNAWMDSHTDSSVKTVVFNVFNSTDYEIYQKLL